MSLLLLFLFGLAIGSFINCVVYRLNHHLSFVKGRSFCPRCKHQLSWKDNIPLFSFFWLRRRCRYCRSPISWQYPSVELGTAVFTVITFVITINQITNSQFLIYNLIFNLLITYSLIVIFVSDLLYEIIPDEVVVWGTFLAVVYLFLSKPQSLVLNLSSGLVAAAFFLLLHLVTKGKGMGFGDVKLVFLIGLVLGWPNTATALFMAFLTGATLGVILILTGKVRIQIQKQ